MPGARLSWRVWALAGVPLFKLENQLKNCKPVTYGVVKSQLVTGRLEQIGVWNRSECVADLQHTRAPESCTLAGRLN